MYGYYGANYDLGDYEGDDMGELDGVMDMLKKEVFGVPAWALALGGAALLAFTKPGKRLLGGLGLGGTAKKNPRRRKNRRARRNAVTMKMNRRRRSRRSRR